jgi:hypothetical protein
MTEPGIFNAWEGWSLMPLADEQGFYDKFLCDKFYLLVCICHFANFSREKSTCSKASML